MTADVAIARFESSHEIHGAVPCVAIQPAGTSERLPVCLFLYGGGGNVENLVGLAPSLAQRWRDGSLAPMIVACAGVPAMCFYLNDAARGMHWESVVADDLLANVRSQFAASARASSRDSSARLLGSANSSPRTRKQPPATKSVHCASCWRPHAIGPANRT
jgi:hypothetical protein